MNEHDIHDIFNESFERCKADSQFLDKFYNIFLSSSDEVQEKFKTTDIDGQKRILLISLSLMVMASVSPEVVVKIAQTHNSKNLDIKPHLYELWLNSMVEAVRQSDSHFDSVIEHAWREIMQPGIDFMISRYDKP